MHGKHGDIYLGDKKVATKAEWSIGTPRSYVDAQSFGDMNKTYTVPLPRMFTGTFKGKADFATFGPGDTKLKLWVHKRPAWWGRLKHRIMRTDWPEYIAVEGEGLVDYTTLTGVAVGTIKFVGPITVHSEPLSRLERYWHRICWTVQGWLR
jgi:hypothetical protein